MHSIHGLPHHCYFFQCPDLVFLILFFEDHFLFLPELSLVQEFLEPAPPSEVLAPLHLLWEVLIA